MAEPAAGGEGGDNGAGGSLKFSLASRKVAKKVAVNEQETRHYKVLITAVEGSKLQAAEPEAPQPGKQLIIPRLENTYRAGPPGARKFAPSFVPPSNDADALKAGEDRFVAAAPTAAAVTEYGLDTRGSGGGGGAPANGEPSSSAAAVSVQRGSLLMPTDPKAFKQEVEKLPEEASLDAYEAMPIEEFGMAMLRGMGWSEGGGVGRSKKDVPAQEYVRRPQRLGLGAQPAALAAKDAAAAAAAEAAKPKRPGDYSKPKKAAPGELVLPPDADGRQRHIKTLDEKLVRRTALAPGPAEGKAMRVVGGRHAGFTCTVQKLLPVEEGRSGEARA